MGVKRYDWRSAEFKRGPCRICGTTERIELAHVIGREFEEPIAPGSSTYRVKAQRVIPLCGPATDPTTCHGKQHRHQLDLVGHLHRDEEVQAVADVGLEAARVRLLPSAYRNKVAA